MDIMELDHHQSSSLTRIRDISPETTIWPSHLVNLVCGRSTDTTTSVGDVATNENDLEMKLDEITACLCHVAMIEIGFVPTFLDIDAVDVRFMDEKTRITSLSSKIPSNLRNSVNGVTTLSYHGIRENPKSLNHATGGIRTTHIENIDSVSTGDGKHLPTTESSSTETTVCKRNKPNTEEIKEEVEPLYVYTSQVDVIMMIQNGQLSLHGHVRSDPTAASPQSSAKSVHLNVNIRNFLPQNCPVKNLDSNAVLSGQQWLHQIQLNGSSLSDLLKIHFGKILLTLIDGIFFEVSLHHLSPELLWKIFRPLPVEDICRITQVSHYMYAVTESDFFWLRMIERDFPNDAPKIRAKFQPNNVPIPEMPDKQNISVSNQPPSSGTNNTADSQVTSPYHEYVRLYNIHHPPPPVRIRPLYRHLLPPRRSFNPLLGVHPPFFRSFF